MKEFSKPEQIWLDPFQRFIEGGVHTLDDLARLNGVSHILLRTIPGVEAQTLFPTLNTVCAVCHVKGQPDGPLCAEHQRAALIDGTPRIFQGDEGTGVSLCGDCKTRVEQLTAKACVENPDHPEDTDTFFEPLRTVN